jgi:small acid-soluble spore protein (thioredoxin-like protein)
LEPNKPDNRADNAQKNEQIAMDTSWNLAQAEQYLEEHGDTIHAKEKADIIAKNERRRESIREHRAEAEDERRDAIHKKTFS